MTPGEEFVGSLLPPKRIPQQNLGAHWDTPAFVRELGVLWAPSSHRPFGLNLPFQHRHSCGLAAPRFNWVQSGATDAETEESFSYWLQDLLRSYGIHATREWHRGGSRPERVWEVEHP